MAGSCFLFLSQGAVEMKNDEQQKEKKMVFLNESERDFPENKESEQRQYQNKDKKNRKNLNQNLEINESETVFFLYGTIKCSLLLLQLHEIEPFEPNLRLLIINHINCLFDHFYFERNFEKFEKHSIYTVRKIHTEFNQWDAMLCLHSFCF